LTLPSADLRSREFRRILLIKLSALGDVVHTIPVLNKLRRRYPNARIDWLTTPPLAELLRHHPGISTVVTFAREEWSKPWRLTPFISYARLAAALRATAYDCVIDMHGQLRTAGFALATGAPVRIGFDRPREAVWEATARKFPAQTRKHAWKGAREGSWIAYTHHIPVPTLDIHAVDRYLSIGPILGLDPGPADFSFPIPDAAEAHIGGLLRERGAADRRLVVLAPGTVWETKHWGAAKFAAVARHFMAQGFAAVLIGSRRERTVCEEVATAAPGAFNVAGETSITELAALIRRAALCVTNDSGPMHLAVALDRPVVSVFGPTDPIWIGPYRRPESALAATLACAPCYFRKLSKCAHGHACMVGISAEAVAERAESILRASTAAATAAPQFVAATAPAIAAETG
jgi:lipopolysaccharide heptosyltransferase I